MTRSPPDPTPNSRRRAIRIEVGNDARSYVSDGQRVTLVPLTIKRRQNRKLLIPPTPESAAATAGGLDAPMIKTLGKAFYWKRLIDEGVYPTTADLARALKLEPGWAAEVLRMTLLAPDIVEAILDGRQPRHLNLQTLRGRHDSLPRDWGEQRRLLSGFARRGFRPYASPGEEQRDEGRADEDRAVGFEGRQVADPCP